MGLSSVYCSISRIAITSAGTRCVFLPLIENSGFGGSDYDKYIPGTLPIFGEYDEYGGIENIVRDENVELIEKLYGCTIDAFCKHLIIGNEFRLNENLKPLDEYTYMWIRGDVWDFITNYHPNTFGRIGYFYLGRPEMLKALGFVYVGESGDKRYTKHYRYLKNDITIDVISDGTYLEFKNNENNYCIGNIKDLKKLGVDTTEFDDKEEVQLWKMFTYENKILKLGWLIGISRTYSSERLMKQLIDLALGENSENITESLDEIITKITKEKQDNVNGFKERFEKRYKESKLTEDEISMMQSYYDSMEVEAYPKDIYARMMENNDFVCETLAKMVVMKRNMYCASTSWEPYVPYQTPQDGFKVHMGMLEAFAKINNKILSNHDYEDNDE